MRKPRAHHAAQHRVQRVAFHRIDHVEFAVRTGIAVEVFGRPVSSFDPKLDTIVRVEARRLRGRLARYYAAEGRAAPLRIGLPVGSYVPLIADRAVRADEDLATRRARELAERGEHFLREALSRESLEKALARFDEAIRVAPDFAPAYVGLARAWFNLGTGWHQPPAVALEHAAEALRHALALDPRDAPAHALLGAVQHQFEYDWQWRSEASGVPSRWHPRTLSSIPLTACTSTGTVPSTPPSVS
ncbi:MAG: hypothetical protein ABI641_11505 [Caldimonas sp.]